MFGYKSVLQLSATTDFTGVVDTLLGRGNESEIELSGFSYDVVQTTDANGKPQGEVRAGRLSFSFSNLPTTEMLEWMISSRKYKDGVITVFDMEDTPLQKVSFVCAACVALTINYSDVNNEYCSTSLSLVAKKLSIDEVRMENDWKNI